MMTAKTTATDPASTMLAAPSAAGGVKVAEPVGFWNTPVPKVVGKGNAEVGVALMGAGVDGGKRSTFSVGEAPGSETV